MTWRASEWTRVIICYWHHQRWDKDSAEVFLGISLIFKKDPTTLIYNLSPDIFAKEKQRQHFLQILTYIYLLSDFLGMGFLSREKQSFRIQQIYTIALQKHLVNFSSLWLKLPYHTVYKYKYKVCSYICRSNSEFQFSKCYRMKMHLFC